MVKHRKSLAQRFIKAGYTPRDAIRAMRILATWNELEWDDLFDEGNVRIKAIPDPDPYDWGDIKPTKQEKERLERLGVFGVITEYRIDGGRWKQADSIWGCGGYENVLNPIENPYVLDLMNSAIDQYASALSVEATESGK